VHCIKACGVIVDHSIWETRTRTGEHWLLQIGTLHKTWIFKTLGQASWHRYYALALLSNM